MNEIRQEMESSFWEHCTIFCLCDRVVVFYALSFLVDTLIPILPVKHLERQSRFNLSKATIFNIIYHYIHFIFLTNLVAVQYMLRIFLYSCMYVVVVNPESTAWNSDPNTVVDSLGAMFLLYEKYLNKEVMGISVTERELNRYLCFIYVVQMLFPPE